MIETLAQIKAPNFTAGIVLHDDVVTQAAPIVRYMQRWSRDRVRAFCLEKGWSVAVVRQAEAEDMNVPPVEPGITQHAESFEVQLPDGRIEFVYFDENAGRRAITGRLTKEAAFARAQALLGQ
jgi:hypothetical protein